jgi:predicted nucleic acid-binding protein
VADYLDTSAAAKLVVAEPESRGLRRYLDQLAAPPFTSDLTRTELVRAVRRLDPSLASVARMVLDALTIVRIPTATFDHAALFEPMAMRSLDALHLAAALSAGDDLDAIVTYDDRLASAAREAGIRTEAPGARR